MTSSATLKDVASAAGVDRSTVSFVINGKGDLHRISHSTQERVLATARQLGYRPNQIERDIALGNTATPVPSIQVGNSQIAGVGKRQIGLILSVASSTDSLALIPNLEPILAETKYRLFNQWRGHLVSRYPPRIQPVPTACRFPHAVRFARTDDPRR